MSHTKFARPDHPIDDLLAERWSPYTFSERPVAQETLLSLFEAARWAASSYNEQPWRFLIASQEDPEAFADLLSCLVEGNQAWARHAPVLVLTAIHRHFARNGKPNAAAPHDLGLAVANLTFEATRRGLAVHQMIGIVPERARTLYAIPDGVDPFTAFAIGYHGDGTTGAETLRQRDQTPRSRRPLDEILFAGGWGRPVTPKPPENG